LIYILLCLTVLTACGDKKTFVLEGNISGLTTPAVYFLTNSNNNGSIVDTVYATEGKFKYTSSSDSIKPIIIYLEDGSVWITVWAKNGQSIKISGDANYPELIEARGNDINDKLSLFKQNNKEIIRERANLTEKLKQTHLETKSSIDEDYSRKLNLGQTLVTNAENFIKENPSSIASLVLIQDYILENNDPAVVGEYLSLIESPAKEDRLYTRLNNVYQRLLNTAVGSIAPDFTITDTKDSILSLNSFNGKYLILSFEKSGCGPCSEDYPVLKQIYNKFKRSEVEIFSIAFEDNKNDWQAVAEEYDINWFQAIDTYGLASPILTVYNINALPDYFLMDRDGRVLAAHTSVKHIQDILTEELNQN
ncbi:MAG: redoxin domain-containing protein, partial [Bacteroidales bacterium]|nr:redoxin domain-containing protein [Bacteroidales bacterium]